LASGLTYSSSTKIDIWALGVNLYLMLFGVFPFDAKNEGDIHGKIINDPLKFPEKITISKSGYNLLNGLLEKNQNLRVDTNGELFDFWYNDEYKKEIIIYF
jgi:serine/threonine protein kinase